MEKINLCKVKFYLKADEDMFLPEVKTSMLRGVLGHAFKNFNCANRLAKDCSGCVLKYNCAYSCFFDSSAAMSSKPFVIYSGQMQRDYKKGDCIEFELTLFGKSIKYLPQFILSFIEIGKQGITSKRFRFSLYSAKDCCGNEIFRDNEIIGLPKDISVGIFSDSIIQAKKATLRFLMPLRLTSFGDLVVKPSFEMIIKAITRRIKLIALEHCGFDPDIDHKMLIEKAKSVAVRNNTLVWKDWTRYSNRQHAKMEFGGLVGDISFEGDLSVFIPYLKAGELLHIGKNCVFGNGKYIITELL